MRWPLASLWWWYSRPRPTARRPPAAPNLVEIGTLTERFESQASFLHVEVFDNPHLIQGDLERAVPVPATEEWGLLTEPWTFVVDSNGDVAAKFEAFTTAQEIEEALLPLLN